MAKSNTNPAAHLRITQSLMKDIREYVSDAGSCGIWIRERWINGRQFDDESKAMKLGTFFEYITTGSLPKNGKVPQPEFMKSEIKKNKGSIEGLGIQQMYEPYREAYENRQKLLDVWAQMGLVIARDKDGKPMSGVKVIKANPLGGPDHEGTWDVVLEATRDVIFGDGFQLKKGDRIIEDIKYSGMKDDYRTVHGWQWTDKQIKYHGTQGKEYSWLGDMKYPFFFRIVDPKGNYIVAFRMVISKEAIEAHLAEANYLYEKLMFLNSVDSLEPRPEYNRCLDCPLFNECEHKHTYPHPVKVTIEE
jgi:hypothetical protein